MPLSPLSNCLLIIIIFLTIGWTTTYISLKDKYTAEQIAFRDYKEASLKSEIQKELLGKQVAKIDKQTNQTLEVFLSIKDAAKSVVGANFSHISAVCNGKRKTAYGFKWMFV